MKYACYRPYLIAMSMFVTSLLVIACGGGGGGGSSSAGDTVTPAGGGSVAILLTDGPADEFDEINITVTRVELLSDSGRVTLYQGSKTFNLLDLTDARVFAVGEEVRTGTYSKIRLTLSDMVLVKKDDAGNVIETAEPKLPGNGKLDLVPRGDFTVVAGQTLIIQIDMDANKSIHIVTTGNDKYQFRPVVFVDILSDDFLGKLVHYHGVIRNINEPEQEFDLCNTSLPVHSEDGSDDRSDGCIQISVVDDTSIFDESGLPTTFSALQEGGEATVVGRFRRLDEGKEQSGEKKRELQDLELVAFVIELGPQGTFQRLDGVAQSMVDGSDQFSMVIDPGQGFVEGSEVSVQLHDGTKIIDKYGDLLLTSVIEAGVVMTVDGVLDVSVSPDVLNAALIVIDMDGNRLQQISGEILENPDLNCGLSLTTTTGDRSVRIGRDTQVFLVTVTESTGASEQIAPEELVPAQSVDVYGVEALDGCFEAETIIAFDLES